MTEKTRVGVVGAGAIGRHHVRILSRLPEADLAGVCDTNLWRAQLAAWRYNSVAFRNYTDVLKQVDAVVIAVPTHAHFEIARAALELGVHVLVEKPIASTVEEARELLRLSEEGGRVLQVGHVERFNPSVLEAFKHIHAPKFITVERLGAFDPRAGHIGVVLDLMIHDLDILLALVNSEIEGLDAIGAHLLSDHEDIANVRIRFRSGCVADLTASRISMERCRKMRIFQKDSYLSLDYLNASLKIYRKKQPVLRSLKDVEVVYPKLDKEEPLKLQLEHFLECIRHNRQPWPNGERGLLALKLALEIAEQLERHEVSPRTPAAAAEWSAGLKRLWGGVHPAPDPGREPLTEVPDGE